MRHIRALVFLLGTFFWLGNVCVVAAKFLPQEYEVSSYADRRRCKYWQQSGCFLDVAEKVCSSGSKPGTVIKHVLTTNSHENVYLCCCPKPYTPCSSADADQNCLHMLLEEFPSKTVSKQRMFEGLQSVRKDLLNKDGDCLQYLAPVFPFAECGREPTPFSRHDLKCEMLMWQWEELGDGKAGEFKQINCPFVEEHKSKDGDDRKGGRKFLDLVEETSVAVDLQNVSSYDHRRLCKYWQQSGCLLDVTEKVCVPESNIQRIIRRLLRLDKRENIFMCCCPYPYRPCRQSEAHPSCLRHLIDEFRTDDITPEEMVVGILNVRRRLLAEDDICGKVLARVDAIAKCGNHPPPFSEPGLVCEMLTWQWEELGDGNKPEFDKARCPFVPVAKAKEGDSRKGASTFLVDDEKTEL